MRTPRINWRGYKFRIVWRIKTSKGCIHVWRNYRHIPTGKCYSCHVRSRQLIFTTHGPRLECDGTHCWIHNVDEVEQNDFPYHRCHECGHLFLTEQEMVDAHNAVIRKMRMNYIKPPLMDRANGETNGVQEMDMSSSFPIVHSASQVYCCPHCTHDF
jgi:hypothetical protein